MTDFELKEKVKQKLYMMNKDPISSFDGKLLLNTRFFYVKIDCLSLEKIESVDDLDRCIDFLQKELSDLEIYFKYDILIKQEYKKELEELNPDVFIELKKHESKEALKIAISRYERRRQDLVNRQITQNAPKVTELSKDEKTLIGAYPDFEKHIPILLQQNYMKKLPNGKWQWLKDTEVLAGYFDSIKSGKKNNWIAVKAVFRDKNNQNLSPDYLKTVKKNLGQDALQELQELQKKTKESLYNQI